MPPRARTILVVRAGAALTLVPALLSAIVQWRGSDIGVAVSAADDGRPQAAAAIVAAAATLYMVYWLKIWPHEHGAWPPMLLLAALAALAVVDELSVSPTNDVWLYVAIVAGCALRPRLAVPAILLVTAAAVAAMFLPVGERPGHTTSRAGPQTTTGAVTAQASAPVALPGLSLRLTFQLSAATLIAVPLLFAGLGTTLVRFFSQTNQQLRAARVLQIQLAAQEERTRVARDLHDSLGHSLALIAVKLQVAEHLIKAADGNAAAEVGEVRQLTLDALRDVRDTVSGYRQPTIDAELTGARIALQAAGIDPQVRDQHGVLVPAVEATCGWIIREATTNVIKHSGAASCRISLACRDGHITVTVVDDGRRQRHNGGGSGSGLQGLRERVHALGGALESGPAAPDPGFRLRATIPLHPEIRDAAD